MRYACCGVRGCCKLFTYQSKFERSCQLILSLLSTAFVTRNKIITDIIWIRVKTNLDLVHSSVENERWFKIMYVIEVRASLLHRLLDIGMLKSLSMEDNSCTKWSAVKFFALSCLFYNLRFYLIVFRVEFVYNWVFFLNIFS